MRIALVITELDPGGAENCLTELAVYLHQQGHHVRVLALGPPPKPPTDRLLQRLKKEQIDVHFGSGVGWTQTFRVLRWLKQQLKEFQPDVVQSMLWHADVLCASALRGSSARWFGGIRVSEPRQWRWRIERWATKRMQKKCVCVSDDVMQHAISRQHIPASKLVVIPNGIRVPEAMAGQAAKRIRYAKITTPRAASCLLVDWNHKRIAALD